MKKITLLVTAIFLMGNAANASERQNSYEDRRPVNVADAEPITFKERGIEFLVFADGQFDFNTQPSSGEIYYKNGRRGTVNTTYGAPANFQNSGTRIEHDAQGRVRRIGNVFINYDAQNRIKRIGSVYMSYNRFALSQVGGLQIQYNRYGQIIGFNGCVNGQNAGTYYYNDHNDYNSNSGSSNNENDYYYYKSDGTKTKVEQTLKK